MDYSPPKLIDRTSKRRHPIEMLRDLLSGLKNEEKKTYQIILDVGLNYTKGVEILKNLAEAELIYEKSYMTSGEQRKERKIYGLTEKGYNYLYKLEEVLETADGILP